MNKTIIVSVLVALAIALCFLIFNQDKELDPRHMRQYAYEKALKNASKRYDRRPTLLRNNEKSFDLYLAYVLVHSDGNFYRYPANCVDDIEVRYREFDILYFKSDAKDKLISYCDYDIEQLIAEGDKYLNKSEGFDRNMMVAMYFYYYAYIKTTKSYLDDNYDYIPSVIEQSRESFTKFRKIRNQISNDYANVINDTPFDQFDAEELQ